MNAAHRWYWLAAAAILAALLLRLPLLSVPLERDEGGYAAIADRLHQGDHLYRDLVESKPPGVFWFYALLQSAGRSVVYLRAMFGLWAALGATLFALLAVRRFGARAGSLGTAMLALTMIAPAYFGFSGNAEMVMLPFTLAALLLLIRTEQGSWPGDLAAGALFALAALTKPVALAEGLAVVALLLTRPVSRRKKIGGLLWTGAGFAAVFGAVCIYFAARGTLDDFLFWSLGYNLDYTSALTVTDRLHALLYQVLKRGMLVRDWPLIALMIGGVIALGRERENRGRFLFVVLWLFGAGLGMSASGRFTPHYFIQVLPPLCLAAGIGLDRALAGCEKIRLGSAAQKAAMAALLALALIYPTATQAHLFAAGPQLSRLLYGLNPFMEGEQIGAYLREHTQPDETIFIAGTEGQFLYHAKRKSATRFIFMYPLGTTHPRAEQWQREAFAEIEKNRPRYIVLMRIGSSMILEKDAPRLLLTETLRLVGGEDYEREAVLIAVSPRETRLVVGEAPAQLPVILDLYRRRD